MDPDAILASLTAASTHWWPVAAWWHVCLLLLVGRLGLRRPLRSRAAGAVCIPPLLSVAAAAASHHNLFNAAVFVLLALGLSAVAYGLPDAPIPRGPGWARGLGAALAALGAVYPHFLPGATPWVYLYAAPLGVVPCPTLCCLVGFSLFSACLTSRAWGLTLGLAGVFYGAFGAFRLHVWLDLALLCGAVALLVVAAARPWRTHAAATATPPVSPNDF